ncbi:hypothetical protein HS7_16330 [Sulfolobales archaeon HS-7]|nr:hypothetical protein HS7_16330 [Sulfolobales archaeon HS-7]
MNRGLSDVVAALLSLVITLILLGAFLSIDGRFFFNSVPTSSQTPDVQLLSVLYADYNSSDICVYVMNYGPGNLVIAYATYGSYFTPVQASVYLVENVSCGKPLLYFEPYGNLISGKEYLIVIPLVVPTNNYNVTIYTTAGNAYEVVPYSV